MLSARIPRYGIAQGNRDRKYLFSERTGLEKEREREKSGRGGHDGEEKSRFGFCCRLRAAREEPIDLQWATVAVVESWPAQKLVLD